jgi:hypothetical protein
MPNHEQLRLQQSRENQAPWKKWGPYLSERQWATVREDSSLEGRTWESFPHEHARSRAYRWGEDGIAGLADDNLRLCFALALWNGHDPILKERLFGLTNSEGNHGEDVKEYYFYLDNTPTHSYMRCLYKYCQAAYPYRELVDINRSRSRQELEYELLDTGVFAQDRYFDVYVEYAKATPEDILIRISASNRGPEAADLHLLPTLWFRNTWQLNHGVLRPQLMDAKDNGTDSQCIAAVHTELGARFLYCEGHPQLLFTENETNAQRLFGSGNAAPYVKDGINDAVIGARTDTVNLQRCGTKAAAHYAFRIGPGATRAICLRLSDAPPKSGAAVFGAGFTAVMESRRREADEFYQSVIPAAASAGEAQIMRQALAGMLWSKQFYHFDVDMWLREHQAHPIQGEGRANPNRHWFHMRSQNIISMPDKWEYPWYAAWDLAFQSVALAPVDVDFAKEQLDLLLQEVYLHPNGQLPAYEWNFGDVNPPVHAWAVLFIHRMQQSLRGAADLEFLKRTFNKLLLNFTWWVNRRDRSGRDVFEGGFLGLDNIGVFDRSAALPTGGVLEQADGTAWLALFCQNMAEISLELAGEDPTYTDLVHKFLEHFLWIAAVMNRPGQRGMWDEEDGFYYDVLLRPDGSAARMKIYSIVGILPLCATTVIEPEQRERVPSVVTRLEERLHAVPELRDMIHPTGKGHRGVNDRGIIALVNPQRLRRILARLLDENQFLGAYGVRALSKAHEQHPYVLQVNGTEHRLEYWPAESRNAMFGGNSNWRGPIWFPVNVMIIRALLQFYLYYGDSFTVECPTGSGRMLTLFEVSRELIRRLVSIFDRDAHGRRPVYGGAEKFQSDPHWRELILFYEYFHGDNGAGIGASHQTGWTGLVASLIQMYHGLDAASLLAGGKSAAFRASRLSPS